MLAGIGSLYSVFLLFGRGGRNFWILRIGIVVLVLTAGAAFHYRGAGYWTIRGLYYALIFGFIVSAVWRNKARRRGVGTRGPDTFSGPSYRRGGMPPPFGGQYPPPQPHGDLPPSVSPANQPPAVPVAGSPIPTPVPVDHPLLSAPGQEPGWYPDRLDPMARHYWDGMTWSHRVKWDGQAWVPA